MSKKKATATKPVVKKNEMVLDSNKNATESYTKNEEELSAILAQFVKREAYIEEVYQIIQELLQVNEEYSVQMETVRTNMCTAVQTAVVGVTEINTFVRGLSSSKEKENLVSIDVALSKAEDGLYGRVTQAYLAIDALKEQAEYLLANRKEIVKNIKTQDNKVMFASMGSDDSVLNRLLKGEHQVVKILL